MEIPVIKAPNLAVATSWEDRIADLGGIPSSRILLDPLPGDASAEDLIRVRQQQDKLCELVDGALVEKAIGWQESLLGGVLIHWLNNFLDSHRLGVATGADGLTRLFGDTIRGPDVAFIAWDRLPGGVLPTEPIPHLVPNFVIEVLSVGNTYGEMSRKRREYFQAGVELVWMVDPRRRTIAVYRTALDVSVLAEGEKLDGGRILPGWEVDLGQLFGKLDQRKEP